MINLVFLQFQISELGKNGRLINLQLSDLMTGVSKRARLLLMDYSQSGDSDDVDSLVEQLGELSNEEL
ncbi:MAG TPA: DNA integrity scanning protein DisA, partial [Thermodesulfobacteriaceae bacterium]|nr:DNA integrity scanning protein DisA [Thermodesulfobacteriaceae bacterium]